MPAECAQTPLGLYLPNNFNTFRFSFGFNVQVERVTKNRFTEKKKKSHCLRTKKDNKNWLETREYTGGQHQAGQNYLASGEEVIGPLWSSLLLSVRTRCASAVRKRKVGQPHTWKSKHNRERGCMEENTREPKTKTERNRPWQGSEKCCILFLIKHEYPPLLIACCFIFLEYINNNWKNYFFQAAQQTTGSIKAARNIWYSFVWLSFRRSQSLVFTAGFPVEKKKVPGENLKVGEKNWKVTPERLRQSF